MLPGQVKIDVVRKVVSGQSVPVGMPHLAERGRGEGAGGVYRRGGGLGKAAVGGGGGGSGVG